MLPEVTLRLKTNKRSRMRTPFGDNRKFGPKKDKPVGILSLVLSVMVFLIFAWVIFLSPHRVRERNVRDGVSEHTEMLRISDELVLWTKVNTLLNF